MSTDEPTEEPMPTNEPAEDPMPTGEPTESSDEPMSTVELVEDEEGKHIHLHEPFAFCCY